MNARQWKYVLVYVSPAAVFVSLYLGGYWSYFSMLYLFVLIPALEFIFSGTTQNMDKVEEEIASQDRFYDLLLYSLVPIQFALMAYFLYRVNDPSLALFEKIGMMTAFGVACGGLGINAAHELGHRSTWYEQLMAKMLLSTTQYMHFFIEHNRGHHKNVSTDDDPASSRYGEPVYTFYIRSTRDSWFSAWKLEAVRLKKAGQAVWGLRNEMLRFQIIQAGIVAGVAYFFGWEVLLLYMGSATMGFLLLETVNYIEHYGLRRKKNEAGFYEKTLPIHSWNSNHSLGRIMLLEVTRHSDHHYIANRKYQVLRHFDESPQMPAGYPAMMLLSLVPPLWFAVMHKQIEKYKATQEGGALA